MSGAPSDSLLEWGGGGGGGRLAYDPIVYSCHIITYISSHMTGKGSHMTITCLLWDGYAILPSVAEL